MMLFTMVGHRQTGLKPYRNFLITKKLKKNNWKLDRFQKPICKTNFYSSKCFSSAALAAQHLDTLKDKLENLKPQEKP